MRKGQSAIEYLTTYGWMLMVVAIVASAVFAFVSSRCVTSASGFEGEDISVSDFGVNADERNLVLVADNRAPNTVFINNVSVESETGIIDTNETEVEIDTGHSKNMPFSNAFEQTDECNEYDLTIEYDSGSLEDQRVRGTITGQFEMLNSPSAPQIETVEQ